MESETQADDREFSHLQGRLLSERIRFHVDRVKHQLPAFELLEKIRHEEFETSVELKYAVYDVQLEIQRVENALRVRQSVLFAENVSNFMFKLREFKKFRMKAENAQLADLVQTCDTELHRILECEDILLSEIGEARSKLIQICNAGGIDPEPYLNHMVDIPLRFENAEQGSS